MPGTVQSYAPGIAPRIEAALDSQSYQRRIEELQKLAGASSCYRSQQPQTALLLLLQCTAARSHRPRFSCSSSNSLPSLP